MRMEIDVREWEEGMAQPVRQGLQGEVALALRETRRGTVRDGLFLVEVAIARPYFWIIVPEKIISSCIRSFSGIF